MAVDIKMCDESSERAGGIGYGECRSNVSKGGEEEYMYDGCDGCTCIDEYRVGGHTPLKQNRRRFPL